ncbi:MAG: DUF1624 domain-containing protein [Oscillospiraceae bacterium]|nr:DUF1624 domain-containing protein [Oscillospiraceae bacterium]
MKKSKRRESLDTLRGLTLVSMIAYHACWDLVYLFGKDWAWYRSDGAYLWQQSICWTFILLSGYCWSLGRQKWKRGLTVFGAGVLISVVTWTVMPESRIFFGVLSLLGSAMLLTIPAEWVLKKLPAVVGLGLNFALFLILRGISGGSVAFGRIAVPQALYANYLTACFGFPPSGFFSTDYFALLPWLFLFWCGYELYRLFPDAGQRDVKLPLITAMGRKSLLIYLLHQPLVYGALTALNFIGIL